MDTVAEQYLSIRYLGAYCKSLNMMDRNHMDCGYSYYPSINDVVDDDDAGE